LASSWGGRSKWLTREEVENDSSPTDGLTPLEHMIRDEMAFNGWYIIRGGWPDFLCITIDAEGNMHHVCLEAKCRSDKLSKSQRRMIMALESMGLPTYVVKNPREIRGILKDYIGRCPAPFVADDIRLDEEDWLG
jgi:hypothetical protein